MIDTTPRLSGPDGALLFGPDTLFASDGGEVICNRHYPIATRTTRLNTRGGPASDFRWEPLTPADTREWRVFVTEFYGPDTSPCEQCRGATERVR